MTKLASFVPVEIKSFKAKNITPRNKRKLLKIKPHNINSEATSKCGGLFQESKGKDRAPQADRQSV